MKIKKMLTILLLGLVVGISTSCENTKYTSTGYVDKSDDFETIAIDGCEYIFRDRGNIRLLALKGNGNCNGL